jgi:hypothetical protein
MDDEDIAKRYLNERGFRFVEGFAINTESMNPTGFDGVKMPGKTLQEALKGHFEETTWWEYGELYFDDIWDAVEYAEENVSKITFDEYFIKRR